MPIDEISLEAEEKMEKSVNFLDNELKGIRTGRASAGLVDHLKVEAYDSQMPIRQLANLATPEASLLVIKPFDPGMLKAIEKAILASSLGLTPANDGKLIRLTLPPLSGERRKHLATQVKQFGEQAKIAIRNARREANKHIDQEKKDSIMTEDEADSGKENIQKLTKEYEEKVDQGISAKTEEITAL